MRGIHFFLIRWAFALGLAWIFVDPCSWVTAAPLNPDIYHTSKLPGEIATLRRDYEQLRKEQDRRKSDLVQVKKEIETYRIRIGNNPKKNKEAARSLEDALERKVILEKKIGQSDPVLRQKYDQHRMLTRALQKRNQELSQIPKGDLSALSPEKAVQTRAALKTLVERANYQLQHYKKIFASSSTGSADMRERANLRNFITELEEEIKIRRRQYAQVDSVIQRYQSQQEFDRQIAEEEPQPERKEKPRTISGTGQPLAAITATPAATAFPLPVATVSPVIAEKPKGDWPKEDMIARAFQFLEDYAFVCVFAFFLAAGLSIFLTLQILDADNERHNYFAPLVIGALTAIFFVLPFPGLFLGLTVFIIAQPIYYRLPIEKLTFSLGLSIAFLAVGSTIFVGALALFLSR